MLKNIGMAIDCTIEDINIELSAQKINSFGFYDTCVNEKSRSYYMLTRLMKGGNFGNHASLGEAQRSFNFFGVCANQPSCTKEFISWIYGDIFEQLQREKGSTAKLLPMKVYKFPDYFKDKIKPFSSFSFYFLLAMALIFFFAVLSTIKVKILRERLLQHEKESKEKEEDQDEKSEKIEKMLKNSI